VQSPHSHRGGGADPIPGPSLADPRHRLGRAGEELAAAHFTRLGFTVLARNVRSRHGEIDLIAFDGHTLVFVEVKTLRGSARPRPLTDEERSPLVHLRERQRVRLRRLAAAWLSESRGERARAREIRFDAVGVTLGAAGELLRLEHLEAAW
jgi:putative endonuclease